MLPLPSCATYPPTGMGRSAIDLSQSPVIRHARSWGVPTRRGRSPRERQTPSDGVLRRIFDDNRRWPDRNPLLRRGGYGHTIKGKLSIPRLWHPSIRVHFCLCRSSRHSPARRLTDCHMKMHRKERSICFTFNFCHIYNKFRVFRIPL